MTDRELMKWALDALDGYARNCGGGTCDAAEALRVRLEKWTARDMAYRPNGLPDWSAAGFGKPPTHSEAWWRHEVSNAYANGYLKARVLCGCGDQIMPDDGAECGTCVTAKNAGKPEWVGLTTAETRVLWNHTKKPSEFASAIEAKLKEKNT